MLRDGKAAKVFIVAVIEVMKDCRPLTLAGLAPSLQKNAIEAEYGTGQAVKTLNSLHQLGHILRIKCSRQMCHSKLMR